MRVSKIICLVHGFYQEHGRAQNERLKWWLPIYWGLWTGLNQDCLACCGCIWCQPQQLDCRLWWWKFCKCAGHEIVCIVSIWIEKNTAPCHWGGWNQSAQNHQQNVISLNQPNCLTLPFFPLDFTFFKTTSWNSKSKNEKNEKLMGEN